MFCEKCGKKLEDGVKFCPSCGNRVEIPENQTDTVHEQPEKSKKSRKKSKLPLVLIAVLAIILIVGGILYGTWENQKDYKLLDYILEYQGLSAKV